MELNCFRTVQFHKIRLQLLKKCMFLNKIFDRHFCEDKTSCFYQMFMLFKNEFSGKEVKISVSRFCRVLELANLFFMKTTYLKFLSFKKSFEIVSCKTNSPNMCIHFI